MKIVKLKPHLLLIILVINKVVTAVFRWCGSLLHECMFDICVVSVNVLIKIVISMYNFLCVMIVLVAVL